MNKYLKLALVIVLVNLIINVTIEIVSAKNKTIASSEAKMGVANPILEIENKSLETQKLTEDSANYSYYFMIKNYNESNRISQIMQQYTIEVITNDECTLSEIKYSLYLCDENNKEEKELEVINNKTQKLTIQANKKQENYFKLKINSINATRDIKDSISIKVKAESIEL